jgi:hypothetical protein
MNGRKTAIGLDSLTGLTTVARQLVVGGKPILSRPEYNPIMNMIENFSCSFGAKLGVGRS